MIGRRLRKILAVYLSLAVVLYAPGAAGWVVIAGDFSTQYDPKRHTISVSKVNVPQVDDLIKKLDDPELQQRVSKDQLGQMQSFLKNFKGSFKDEESPDAQKAIEQLSADLSDPKKDLGLSLSEAFDRLSPIARKSTESDNVVQVLNQSGKSQTVRVIDGRTSRILFTQHSAEIDDDVYRKVIKRPDPNDPKNEVVDAIVIESKKGAATEQRIVYNRRVELLLKNLKKLYYDQPGLARKIKDNCNVADPANHQPAAQIGKAENPRDENMTDNACKKMQEFFDGKRARFLADTNAKPYGYDINILGYLDKLAKAAAADKLNGLDWKELQAVQRMAMKFYNDNQLDTMQKMVLVELKTYFGQVTNATVKESKNGTENLDATMKDLGELQKIFDEFKKGNFEGYSTLMTKFFAKADIEDPKYVSKDIMLLASETFADVANAVKAQQRVAQGGLTGEEIDATVEESQQWLKLAQVHLQEFDMHTLGIQLERLESGHLRDHLGLRTDDLKFKIDGKEVTLSAAQNQAQALKLAQTAQEQYLPALEQINGEIKANLVKQAIAGFYLTYANITRAFLYDDTMQERVRALAGKLGEIKDLYVSLQFDAVKNGPKFKGKSETQKLQGNLYELFVTSMATDYPDVYKNVQDLEALRKRISDLAQIQSAQRVRDDIKPLIDEFVRLEKLVMKAVADSLLVQAKQLEDAKKPEYAAELRAQAASIKAADMPIIDDVKKEAQNLGIKQSKVFAAVQDFSSQARIYDMMNELDLYCAKYASSEFVTSKGDTAASKAIGMKWWDRVLDWLSFGHRDDVVDAGMKINPLTEKAFKMLGQNRDERHRIMLLLSQGKFQEAIDRIAALDPNHKPVDDAIKALKAKNAAAALAVLPKLECKDGERNNIRNLINAGKLDEAIAALRKLDGALRAMDEYEADKAIEDPFEVLDFDSSLTKTPENPHLVMAQGVIQNMFGQLQSYIMGYTITAAVYDTIVVSVLTLGMGAASRYAIGAAKGIIAFGEALQAAKAAEAVGEVSKMARVLRTLVNIGKFIISIPGKIIVYAGKWLESSMMGIRNMLGISNIGKGLSAGEKAWAIVRIGLPNALKFQVKTAVIMAGASAGIQTVTYYANPDSSQFKGGWDAAKNGFIQGAGFGAKSGVFILMSPIQAEAFGPGAAGNIVRAVADSPGPVSSLSQGVAKVVASDSAMATMGPLGWAKSASLAASPGFYTAAKALVWGGAMLDGAFKYMLASAVAHNVASVGAYYEYKLTHAKDGTKEGATVEMQALAQGEAFGMTMAEMSWLLLPVHQQSNDKSVKESIAREDAFNAAVNQGLAPEIAQSSGKDPVFYDKPWSQQTWPERMRGFWAGVTGDKAYEPPKGKLNVDAGTRKQANKIEMKEMSDAELLDIATTPRENIGKYRLKADLGTDFESGSYSNEPMKPAEPAEKADASGGSRFSKPAQGDAVDLRGLNIRVTDEAITTAKELLVERLQGRKGAATRLEVLRAKGELDSTAGQIKDAALELKKGVQPGSDAVEETAAKLDAAADQAEQLAKNSKNQLVKERAEGLAESARGLADMARDGKATPEQLADKSVQVKKAAEASVLGRMQVLVETVGNADLATQGRAEPGSYWQKIKDMVKGSPLESPSDAIVRNLKNGVKAEASEDTKARSTALDDTAKEVKQAAAALKERVKKVLESPEAMDGSVDDIKEAAGQVSDAAKKLEEAAGKIGDLKIKQDAVDLGKSADRILELARTDKLTAEGIGENPKDIKKAAGKLAVIADAIEAAGNDISRGASSIQASELARQAITSVNSQMEQKIGNKVTEAERLRAAGDVKGADALEREALALQATRKSIESDAFLQFVNEKMGKDFEGYRSGRINHTSVMKSIDLFLETWDKGVFGQQWGTFTVNAKGEKVWAIDPAHALINKNGDVISGFRGPQRETIRNILESMAEGHDLTFGLLKTGGGKTLVSFVLLSFMDTLARQKGKQGAIFVTVNGDLVAQAYDDYRSLFNGREPRFEIKTVSDFMADEAMSKATGGMSPYKTHDVVFDEFDQLGTQTALSLGSDNGRLSFPEIDPVQKALQRGVSDLHDFYAKYENVTGKNVDGGELMRLLQQKDSPFAKDFEALRGKYIKEVREAIAQTRTSDFKAEVLDLNSPLYKDLGITNREQFMNRFGMEPEQVYKELRAEQDHAFGGGWRSLWDVGVIKRQHGGLDGYITKVFLGGYQAMSMDGLGKLYDAKLDPSGKKLVQYHNDVPLDNLDTMYRSFLELKHGIPLTLDFDNLTIVNFSDLNHAAKESGATVVAVSGTMPDQLRPFMEKMGWNILGDVNPGQKVNYQLLDPVAKSVRDVAVMLKGGKIDAAMDKMDRLGVEDAAQTQIKDLASAGKIDEAVAKLTEISKPNSEYHEVVSGIRDLVDAGKPEAKNLGVLFAESKDAYAKFGAEMDALAPKFSGNETVGAKYQRLTAESVRLEADMARLRGDPNAQTQYAKAKADYLKVEAELDPLRTIPRQRRVIAVTPDSNFLVQEWLMPEGIEAKNMGALKAGQADAVIFIGQGGFRGLDLPFKAYHDGVIRMYITDPGSLSTVNRRQLTGRIDTGRMPPGATGEIVGLLREGSVLSTEAYGKIANNALRELGGNGIDVHWNAIQGLLKDRVAGGQAVTEDGVRDFLKTVPPTDDPEAVKLYGDIRYLYQDLLTLRELSKIIKPEDLQAAMKDPVEARKLVSRRDVADVLLTDDAIQSIMAQQQKNAEIESLKSSGIFDPPKPNLIQQFMMKLRSVGAAPAQ